MLEAKNPWHLRSGATAMDGAGDAIDQVIYRMDNLVAGSVIGGADAWTGEGASAYVQAFQNQVAAFRRSTSVLREAARVLNWLADRADEINALREKARALREEADRIGSSGGPLDVAAHARAEWLRIQAMGYEAEADAKAEIADAEGTLKFGKIELEEWAPKALAEVDQIRRYVTTGFNNLVSHPGATINATLEVVGGGLEAVGGAAFGVATSETGVGAVVGGVVAIDGGSHVVSGVGDLASIFNGDMNAVGTHNPLKNAFETVGGEAGGEAYDVMSFGLSFVAPEGMIARAGEVEHLVGMTPAADAAVGVSQKVRELWEGLSRYRFGFSKVQVVTPEGHVMLMSAEREGSSVQMAKVGSESTRGTYDISKLQGIDNFRAGALEHILNGEINSKGHAVGFHYEGLPNANGRVVPGTRSTPDEYGVYEAQVEVNGVRKKGNGGVSSFFPRSWEPQHVVNAINEAYANKVHLYGNTYEGKTSTGMAIQMYLDKNQQIISAFPVY